MIFTLRDYQGEAVEKIRDAYRKGHTAPLLVCPTGGGKTIIFCYIAENSAAKGKRILILVHRQELLNQTSRKLREMEVEHGLIAAGHSMTGDPVQVASVQTLVRRLDRVQKPDMIIVDECHHSTAGTWKKILDQWPDTKLLGVTATPIRMDGKGLGKHCGGFYDAIVNGPSMRWLIDNGFLKQPVVYAPPSGLDLSGIRTIAGDYDKKETNKRVDKPVITGCAIEHYKRLCPGVPAIVFCASIAHAEHVTEQAKLNGISAEIIEGSLPDSVRKKRIEMLGSGTLNWLVSVDIVSEGTDIPICGAAILLRPTKSMGLYLQQTGRALRPEGRRTAIILDHVGNCLRHGLPDDDRTWTLDGYKKVRRGKKNDGPDIQLTMCKKCFAIFSRGKMVCPQCGTVVEISGREPKQVDGQLQQVTHVDIQKKSSQKYSRRDWVQLRGLMSEVEARGMKPHLAYRLLHRLRNKGILPDPNVFEQKEVMYG